MRLHELARELDADSKRLLAIAKELGLGIKSHSSNLPRGTEGILRAAWLEELEDQKAAEPAPEAKGAHEITVRVTVGGAEEEAVATEEAPAPEPVVEEAEPEEVAVPEPAAEEPPSAPVAEPVEAAVAAAPVEEPVAAAPAPAEAAAPDSAESREVVVTFGGQPAAGTDAPQEEGQGAPAEAEAGEPATKAAPDEEEVRPIGVPNVPTRKERRTAKILGKIDLEPQEAPPPGRRSAPAFDPLDPTRMVPERQRPAARKPGYGATEEHRPRTGRPDKSGSEFVFDPEDNTALSAIRLGHFQGRRRGAPRRPPPRRSRLGGVRRSRKPSVRPTHPVTVRAPIGVRELSEELGIKAREILMNFPGVFDPRDKNAVLDQARLEELAVALDRDITVLAEETAETRLLTLEDERRKALAGESGPRPPVVAVMGHVDHGKTTLLDKLRNTRVAAKEAGGITQKTSAYMVKTASGAAVTFLDTPGHKAFTEMRSRGAQVTDVAVLVVAADDGVMEQTLEAIDHAKAADVPMVVAINKCDRPGVDTQRVRQQLASAGVFVEDYGGEVGVVECSAVTGKGLDALVERLALETEILELKGDPKVPARGVVIDSTKDPKLGIVATVVVQNGTLRAKDAILAGTAVGRVRWLLDDRGKRVVEAGPSVPVQVVGFEEPPAAGSQLMVVEDQDLAREVAAERREAGKEELTPAVDAVTLENLFATIESQQVIEVNTILKADNMGSLDVLRQTVEGVSHPEVRFKVIRTGVGGISEDDVLLASASNAFIIGFGVVPDVPARQAIQRTGVDVKYYEVIYEMTEDLEKAIEGRLGTERQETVTGHAEIRAIFKSSRYGNIAGCFVTDGTVNRDSHVRLVRDGKVVHTGRLDSLKRFKDDVKEVREAYECGMHLAGYNDIKEGDIIEAFTVTEVKRTLESTSSGSGGN